MTKKIIFILLFDIVFGVLAKAQSTIQIITNYSAHQEFNDYTFREIQLLNDGPAKDVLVEIIVRNQSTKKLVQKQTLGQRIDKGLTQLNFSNFDIVEYSDVMSDVLKSGGFISSGRIEICVMVRVRAEEKETSECEEVNLVSSNEINLLMPGNGEFIETLLPDLEWISTYSRDFSYNLLLSELAPYSNNDQAIVANFKLLNLTQKQLILSYPFDAPVLKYGVTYVWKVLVVNSFGTVIDQSETWRFTPVEKIKIENKDNGYTLIHKDFNNGNYLYNNSIRFLYDNRSKDDKLNYRIVDLNTGSDIVSLPEINILYGLNKIAINLEDLKGVNKKHKYSLVVRNSFREEYKMNFEVNFKN